MKLDDISKRLGDLLEDYPTDDVLISFLNAALSDIERQLNASGYFPRFSINETEVPQPPLPEIMYSNYDYDTKTTVSQAFVDLIIYKACELEASADANYNKVYDFQSRFSNTYINIVNNIDKHVFIPGILNTFLGTYVPNGFDNDSVNTLSDSALGW